MAIPRAEEEGEMCIINFSSFSRLELQKYWNKVINTQALALQASLHLFFWYQLAFSPCLTRNIASFGRESTANYLYSTFFVLKSMKIQNEMRGTTDFVRLCWCSWQQQIESQSGLVQRCRTSRAQQVGNAFCAPNLSVENCSILSSRSRGKPRKLFAVPSTLSDPHQYGIRKAFGELSAVGAH